MKLRNKKTGEVVDFKIIADYDDCTSGWRLEKQDGSVLFYDHIDEIKEEWDDYRPTEPVIKDEKVRKAVRAWAEASELEHFTVVNEHFNCCKIMGRKGNRVSKIEFQTTIPNTTHRTYAIAELCGEEEE